MNLSRFAVLRCGLMLVLSLGGLELSAKPVTWGQDHQGQLGIGTTVASTVPVQTLQTGALAGKTITALATSSFHTVALSSDGQVFAWGINPTGQLGTGNTLPSAEPVVVTGGSLTGKTVAAIAAGQDFTLAVASDGTLHAWGASTSGQLGQGNSFSSFVPVQITGGVLAGKSVAKIATGYYHALALTTDGLLVAWGQNTSGQLGDGSTTNRSLPVAVDTSGVLMGLTITELAGGQASTAVVDSLGHVYTWGSNANAQLGDGSQTSRSVPVAVVRTGVLAGKSVSKVACGSVHTLALTTDGLLYAWGSNFSGSLGTGSTSGYETSPVAVLMSGALAGLTPVDITACTASCAVRTSNGQLFAWGQNDQGQVGDGTTQQRTAATAVSTAGVLTGKTVSVLSRGPTSATVLGVTSDGLVFGWGASGYALHGTGAQKWERAPKNVFGIHDTTTAVAAGRDHSLYATVTGKLYSMGANTFGQLGISTTTVTRTLPIEITNNGSLTGRTVSKLAAGGLHSAAITTDGRLHTWGANSNGQIGNGGTTLQSSPVLIGSSGLLAGKTITAVACGASHTLVLASDGKLYAWGLNSSGQLGDGTTTQRTSPVAVDMTGVLSGETVVAIACGASHSLCATASGKVITWGQGTSGQIGDAATSNRTTPTAVDTSGALLGKTITKVAAGDFFSLAISSDGLVYGWGSNPYGQLGDGTNSQRTSPTAVIVSGVLAGKQIAAAAAANAHTVLLSTEGQVFTMGRNMYGSLGNNGITDSNVPVAVDTSGVLTSNAVTAVACGINGFHTIIASEPLLPEIAVEQPEGNNLVAGASTISWGTVANSAVVEKTFTIKNSGTGSLNNIVLSITGTDAPRFSIGTAPPTSIAAAASATFVLRFTAPGSAGTSNAQLQIASNDGNENPFNLNLYGVSAAPVIITTPPQNKYVVAGSNVTFSVTAAGSTPLSYQWRKGGENISLATSSTYTINNVSNANVGSYDVVVTNTVGSATSDPATLSLGTVPVITQEPVQQNVNAGGNAQFSVTVTGSGTLSYQWYRYYNTLLPGETGSTLQLQNVSEAQEGWYYVRVTSQYGADLSSYGYLQVNDPVSIYGDPQSKVLNPGASSYLSVSHTGSAPVTYQWRKGGEPIVGATGSVLNFTSVSEADEGSYDVVVTNPVNSVTSGPATVSVNDPVSITTPPASVAVNPNGSTTLSVVATGTPMLSYQWRRNGSNIPGANSASWTINPVTSASTGSYTVVVTNVVGATVSLPAVVSLNVVPTITVPPSSKVVGVGEAVTFSVTAAGTAPFQYQWQKGEQDIPLETGSSLTLANVSGASTGSYRVIVSNIAGTATSAAATLDVVGGIPRITTQPSHQLLVAGSSATLSVAAVGTPPLRYQWRKNGRALAGATADTLLISNVSTASAGAYSVVVTSVNSSVSSDAQVGVVLLTSETISQPENGSASFRITTAGNGLDHEWQRNGAPLTLSSRYALAELGRKLTIKPLYAADTGTFRCVVRGPGGNTVNGAANELRVITDKPDIVDTFAMAPVVIGSLVNLPLDCDPTPGRTPTSYSALGLPTGLTINSKTGVIGGRATVWRSLPYEVIFTARNSKGSDTLKTTLTVSPLPSTTPGTYEGLVSRHLALGDNLGGSFNLVVASNASFTAKLLLGKETFTLKGMLETVVQTGESTASLPVLSKVHPGLMLDLEIVAGANSMLGTLRLGPTTHLFSAAFSPAITTAATFNTAWWPEEIESSGDWPYGNGWCIFTVGKTGSVAWRGKLSDDTAITGSARLGAEGQFPVHLLLYGGTGSFQGWHFIAGTDMNGTATWVKAAQPATSKTRLYKEGFGLHSLVIAGGRFTKPAAGTTILGIQPENVDSDNALLHIGGFGSYQVQSLLVYRDHTVMVANGLADELIAFGMRINPATGEFSGSFVSELFDPDSAFTWFRVSPYYGLVVQRSNFQLGLGYSLSAQYPTEEGETINNTPVLSREVIFEKEP